MRLTKRFMKRISFVLLVVCLCLSAVSCKKLFYSEKKIYARGEVTVNGVPSYNGELNDVLDAGNRRGCQYFTEEFKLVDSARSFYILDIEDKEYGLRMIIYLGCKDPTYFHDGKRYYYDENELQNHSTVWWDEDNWCRIEKAENRFSIDVRSSDLTDINTQNYIRAWFQFDLIEKDGLSYSLTFECENSPEGKTPYTVSGKFYFYNVCGKEFRSHIKKSN